MNRVQEAFFVGWVAITIAGALASFGYIVWQVLTDLPLGLAFLGMMAVLVAWLMLGIWLSGKRQATKPQ